MVAETEREQLADPLRGEQPFVGLREECGRGFHLLPHVHEPARLQVMDEIAAAASPETPFVLQHIEQVRVQRLVLAETVGAGTPLEDHEPALFGGGPSVRAGSAASTRLNRVRINRGSPSPPPTTIAVFPDNVSRYDAMARQFPGSSRFQSRVFGSSLSTGKSRDYQSIPPQEIAPAEVAPRTCGVLTRWCRRESP